jgi:hypothetical protein
VPSFVDPLAVDLRNDAEPVIVTHG